MRARRKQKRVFQHQSRTSIPPETISDEVYNDYKTKVVSSMELKPLIDAEQESELLTENFPLMQIQLQSSN